MKFINYISTFLFAGTIALASCSQQEDTLEDRSDDIQGLQLSVSDGGFLNAETRAIDKGKLTTFTDGDAIGVFAVKGGKIVDDINNRKFEMVDGVWELIDGEVIEYKESEFKKMKFYAYYPYNESTIINPDPAAENPFEKLVKDWKVGADQSEENYTKYDLMTSVGSSAGQNLQGKVTFVMQHQMGLAIIKMPSLAYSFTNGGIDDYELSVTMGDFSLNNAVGKPYYDKTDSTYRVLVTPDSKFYIKGSYTGVKEMEYKVEETLKSGAAKKYTIKDPSKIAHTLAVGDYFCADGSIVSKDVDNVPSNCVGIVFYVGNPQPSITDASKYTEAVDALRRDYPKCKHGLVLALNNALLDGVEKGRFSTANKFYYSTWFKTDEDYKDKYVNTERGKEVANIIPGFMGYNNTVLMEVGAMKSDDYKKGAGNALTTLLAYRTEVELPSVTTGWYFPSDGDLKALQKVVNAVNIGVKKANGNELIINNEATLNGTFYWSNTERNNEWMWVNTLGSGGDGTNPGTGSLTAQRCAKGYDGYYRMMFAF